MIIDTHTHTYFAELEAKQDEVVARMKERGVESAVQIGCDIESSQKAIALAKKYPDTFFATIWFHPTEIQDWTEEQIVTGIAELEDLVVADRGGNSGNRVIVGIGETGLDYHYLEETVDPARAEKRKAIQAVSFRLQAELAAKYGLPVIIHNRDARDDMLDMVRTLPLGNFVMHCYSEDAEYAEKILEMEKALRAQSSQNISQETLTKRAYFSFSGILTYKNAIQVQKAAKSIPLDRILIETDAPFLSPQPVRWTVNEPANTRYVLEKLAELRNEPLGMAEEATHANSKRFYGL